MSLQKDRAIQIQEKLERHILHGLACEWERALDILNSDDKEKLRKPSFSLQDMKGKWGYWSSEKKEISLNRNLPYNHTWDAVREILIHEMAHQFAEQVLGDHDEPPHGPKFKRACYLLRANPKASGDYKPLDDRILHGSISSEDRMMLRVKKLMALAQSQNQHEAEAAMVKAHELIAKYNIDLLSRDEDRDFINVFVGSPALRHFREEYHLANLMQDFYFVHTIWVSAYVLEKGKMGNVLEISGTVQNIKISSYVYDFIKHYIDSQWHKYNKNRGLNRYRKTDFAVGVIEGFHSKLNAQTKKEERIKEKFGLIKIEDPLLLKHIKYKYPHTATVRGKDLKLNRMVLNDGIGVGKELVISKGITERKTGRKLLIE